MDSRLVKVLHDENGDGRVIKKWTVKGQSRG